MIEEFKKKLECPADELAFYTKEPMNRHTSFRIGGPAKRMAFPETREQLVVLTGFLQDAGVKPLLIGNGTNLLVADEGLDTVVIDTSARLAQMRLTDEDTIEADAGVSLCQLAVFAWKNGLTGLEFAHGIPGTLGGAVMALGGFAAGGRLVSDNPMAYVVLLYLALLSAVAYSLWAVLLRVNPVSRVAVYTFLQPIFGVILSLLLVDRNSDAPLLRYTAALAMICVSIAVVNRGQRQEEAKISGSTSSEKA